MDPEKPAEPTKEPAKVHLHAEEHGAEHPPAHGHGTAAAHGHGHGNLPADYIPEGSIQDTALIWIAVFSLFGLLWFGAMVLMGPANEAGHHGAATPTHEAPHETPHEGSGAGVAH